MMPPVEGIGVCTVCGGNLVTFYLCYHCSGTRPTDTDVVGSEWKCSTCSESSPTQFACRNCGTRFLYDEVVRNQKIETDACPECKTPVQKGKYICLECGADLRRTYDTVKEPPTVRVPRRMKGEFDEGDVREVARVPGVGLKKAEALCKAGYSSLWKLKNASQGRLATIPTIGPENARRIKTAMNLIIVLPRIRSKDDILDEERECKKCGLPTSLFSEKCPDCGALFDPEDLEKDLKEEIASEGPNAIIEFYGRSLTRRPNDQQLWYALGLSLNEAGRTYAAKKAIERAKKLDPSNPRYTRLEQLLERHSEEPPTQASEAASGESRPIKATTWAPVPEKPSPPPPPPPSTLPPPYEPPTGDVSKEASSTEEKPRTCFRCGKQLPSGSEICSSCTSPEAKAEPPSVVATALVKELETLVETVEAEPEPAEPPSPTEQTGLASEPPTIEVVDASRREDSKAPVAIGRRPMLSGYGLVNGKGRVNGLINGNGFINGGTISELPMLRGNAVGKYAAVATVLVTIFLIINTIFFIPVEPSRTIRIDGSMMDWQGMGKYDSAIPTGNPNTNLTSYSLFFEDNTIYFMARVEGTFFGDNVGVDSLYIFIDADSDSSTGYVCGALGADYMVFVDGYDGAATRYGLQAFEGIDRLNWNNWMSRGNINVAVSGPFIEGSIQAAQMPLQSPKSLLAKFVVDDQEGNQGEGLLAIGLDYGVLEITQTAMTGVLPASMTEFLNLTFSVTGPSITLDHDSVIIAHTPGTLVDMSPPTFTVSEGNPVTVRVMMDASVLPAGDVVEAGISWVNTQMPVTVHGGPARAYVISPPTGKRIDGLFGDWPAPHLNTAPTTADASLDIDQYDASSSGETAFFYMRTKAASLRGTFSPVLRSRQLSPGTGGGGTPLPLPKVSGESVARAYIDTDQANSSGFAVGGLRAKYMLEAKGQFGNLHSITTYRWEGRWVLFQGSPKFAKGELQMEMSLSVPTVDMSNCSYVLQTSDWRGAGDETVLTRTRGGEDTRTRGGNIIVMGTSSLMIAYPTQTPPIIDGDWSTTEWQDADDYTGDGLTIYAMQDGTNLFIAVRVLNDHINNSGDYAAIAFDTDNQNEAGPDKWDKMFKATDPDGSTVNEDYNGNGAGWNASYVSPYSWSINGKLDTDDGNIVTYEFAIPFEEVWNTSDPTSGQLAGMAIHAHDANDTGFDYHWGSSDLNTPSTYGHVQIPEFEQVVVVMLVAPAIVIMIRRRGKNHKPRGH